MTPHITAIMDFPRVVGIEAQPCRCKRCSAEAQRSYDGFPLCEYHGSRFVWAWQRIQVRAIRSYAARSIAAAEEIKHLGE